jgi:hypothetical protein
MAGYVAPHHPRTMQGWPGRLTLKVTLAVTWTVIAVTGQQPLVRISLNRANNGGDSCSAPERRNSIQHKVRGTKLESARHMRSFRAASSEVG